MFFGHTILDFFGNEADWTVGTVLTWLELFTMDIKQ